MNKSKGKDFTPAETVHLLKIIERHKKTIENKKTDKVCVGEKLRAWELVARQYNATARDGSRTVNNLQNAYKNIKKKTKKAYSSEKMTMPIKNEFGEDWPAVSQVVEAPETECELQFVNLKEEAKKQLHEKKAFMGTGGGPPEKDEDVVKGLTGPASDGSYNQYDGDRLLAGPEPYIEFEEVIMPAKPVEEIMEPFENKRGNRKRKNSHLLKTNKNISASEKFKDIAECKSELVRMQLATEEIKFKDSLAQYEHNQKIRALELEQLKRKIERNEQLHDRELART